MGNHVSPSQCMDAAAIAKNNNGGRTSGQVMSYRIGQTKAMASVDHSLTIARLLLRCLYSIRPGSRIPETVRTDT